MQSKSTTRCTFLPSSSFLWHFPWNRYTHQSLKSHLCVTWLIYICLIHVLHDLFIYVSHSCFTWLIYIYHVTFICKISKWTTHCTPLRIYDTPTICVSFMCDMVHDPFIEVMSHLYMSCHIYMWRIRVNYPLHLNLNMWHTNHMWLTNQTWLIHVLHDPFIYNMTHIYIYMWRTKSTTHYTSIWTHETPIMCLSHVLRDLFIYVMSHLYVTPPSQLATAPHWPFRV